MFNYPDPRTTDSRGHRLQRIFEVIPGFVTWFTLIGMFVFSFWLPVWVAVWPLFCRAWIPCLQGE